MKLVPLAGALLLMGCGAPAAVVWGTVGSVAGFAGKAADLDRDLFDYWKGRPTRPGNGCNDFSCM